LFAVQYVGYEDGFGTATNTVIENLGDQFVGFAGGSGVVTDTSIKNDGYQFVGISGGTGTATNTTINFDDSGGVFGLAAGQYIGVFSGGIGTAVSTTIVHGFQEVGDVGGTGYATSTTIEVGYQYVGDDHGVGYAASTTISNGVQIVGESGGTGFASATSDFGGQFVGATTELAMQPTLPYLATQLLASNGSALIVERGTRAIRRSTAEYRPSAIIAERVLRQTQQ
jgi:hypothetical protein